MRYFGLMEAFKHTDSVQDLEDFAVNVNYYSFAGCKQREYTIFGSNMCPPNR